MFNNSDCPEDLPYHFNDNKKVIGKFKDETSGVPIVEFVGLKSKMYSYVKDNNKGNKTAKGIKRIVIKNNIKHEDCKNTLFNNKQSGSLNKPIKVIIFIGLPYSLQ